MRARGSQPPPPYCKNNAGTFVEKCRHYTLHRYIDRWLSIDIADRHPNLLTHRCGPIHRGADRLKIQNPPTRRMYLRVFLRILWKRQRAVTSTCHSTFSSQSQEESFSSRLVQTCLSGWVSHFRCEVAILTLSRKSWIPGLRANRRMARE